jgi:hypothetical protein
VDFVDVVNLVKVELFYLYIDPISSFNDFMFDDFTKLLLDFYDSFLLFFWCSNVNELQKFIGFKILGQIYSIHTHSTTYGFWIKVDKMLLKGL